MCVFLKQSKILKDIFVPRTLSSLNGGANVTAGVCGISIISFCLSVIFLRNREKQVAN